MRILIQGAGPAGMTLALALHRLGMAPVLIERQPKGPSGGYVVGLRHNGLRAAAALGLDKALLAQRIQIGRSCYVTPDAKPFLSFDYAKLMAAAPGGMLAILRGDIMDVLEAESDGIGMRHGVSIETLKQDDAGVHVTLSDGYSDSFDLVVGADGHRSALRRMVFGPDETCVTELGYRVAAWRYVPKEVLTQSVSGISDVGQQASIYRLNDGSAETLLVWRDQDISRHDAADKLKRVEELFGRWPEPLAQAISACEDWSSSFADKLALVKLGSWRRGRVVLLGDAAWSMALISGEGPSTAMAGALNLAGGLANGDVDQALDSFEAELRPIVEKIQKNAGRIGGNSYHPAGLAWLCKSI